MSEQAGHCSKCGKVVVYLKGKLRHGFFQDGFECKTDPWDIRLVTKRRERNEKH